MLKDKSKEPTCQGLDMKIHDVYLNASSEKCTSLAVETSKDPELASLKHLILNVGPVKEVNVSKI